ncbi:MAG: hypothetical protein UIB31_00800 [Methanobrevibacter sp.]|nr:hypothetical protein [Methanobrevibacter sp.]
MENPNHDVTAMSISGIWGDISIFDVIFHTCLLHCQTPEISTGSLRRHDVCIMALNVICF